ncbi:helix-turn-helix transcriptional regulator [Halobacillus litoralis]|uniref:helix-turn-helix transcriptional regulator n=1 Tax=Halobacillus litoralis TaxID=45668 RepID=UPI001CD60D91|nr:helix-turn-helix transcriptional regulator [Halobacillus litoralis]MCA1021821.1 helix-turn-helix domain-containing protein [Halobacillus litoralis]
MKPGQALKEMRNGLGLTQDAVANDLNISKQSVSHYESERRTFQEDVARESLKTYDDPVYALSIISEFSGGYTAPKINGRALEWHRLSLEEFAIREVNEAVSILNQVSLIKSPNETSAEEKERIAEAIDEILDAEMALSNLKAILGKEYRISIKERVKKRKPVWKSRGWIE